MFYLNVLKILSLRLGSGHEPHNHKLQSTTIIGTVFDNDIIITN